MPVMRRLLASVLAAAAFAAGSAPAFAQTSPSVHTHATRYDAMGRVVGTISPDPDGINTGTLKFPAVRNTYDAAGRLEKVETGELSTWKPQADLPSRWGGAFNMLSSVTTLYDASDRKVRETTRGSNNSITAIVQYSYDAVGRLECTAQRMNLPAAVPASACTLATEGSNGPDRITRNVYDAAGQLTKVQKAYGTPLQQDEATYTYSNNGKRTSLVDARGYKASMSWDGHDRQVQWNFPSKTQTGVISTGGNGLPNDYELYTYDAAGNRLTLRKRDGSTLSYAYDALGRMATKTVPERTGLASTHTRDVYYGYDLRGLQTYARFDSASGEGVSNAYDGFGRLSSSSLNMNGVTRQLSYLHDANGNRTRVTHPDATYFTYLFDGLDRATGVRRSASIALRDYAYSNRGTIASMTMAGASAGTSTLGYDTIGRLSSLAHNVTGTADDVNWTYSYSPASQLLSQVRNNNAYAWTAHATVDRNYTTNGLNQYTAAGAAAITHDANANLSSDGTSSYVYDIENRLVTASGGASATLRYDPLGRLYEIAGTTTTRLLYDGDELVAEYNSSGTLLRRYVHGSGVDDPVVWYEGSGTASSELRHLITDRQGSVVAVTDSSGNRLHINKYDEYGIPLTTASTTPGVYGRFAYTGQIWIPELGMYHYKARAYSPTLGRFMQTDPIGYDDQINLYAYVANDPMNNTDPTGESALAIAQSTLGWISADVAIPDPSDAAVPKWVVYAVAGAVAGAVIITTTGGIKPEAVLENRRNRGNRGVRGGQNRGERGQAAKPAGTGDPGKKANTGKGYRTDNQTGKKIPLPPPPKPKPPEPERSVTRGKKPPSDPNGPA